MPLAALLDDTKMSIVKEIVGAECDDSAGLNGRCVFGLATQKGAVRHDVLFFIIV